MSTTVQTADIFFIAQPFEPKLRLTSGHRLPERRNSLLCKHFTSTFAAGPGSQAKARLVRSRWITTRCAGTSRPLPNSPVSPLLDWSAAFALAAR